MRLSVFFEWEQKNYRSRLSLSFGWGAVSLSRQERAISIFIGVRVQC